MRLTHIQNKYLYEGLDREASNTMMLWESAGFKLREAALTADQIQQIFQSVEQGATAAGGNRTMLGKGKDAASAVNKAWEDLKTKIQNSGPIKNVDNAYDSAVAKIEAGLGGPDNAINQVIQKYRKFAKEHPIAQGFIYSALIAAAGISGAGLGGAAVLGLLKMTDKLLQGEKFSSAAYSGAKTGAMAFAASKLGDLIKGVKPGEQVPPPKPGSAAWEKRDFDNYDYYLHPENNSVVQVAKGSGSPFMPGNANYAGREAMKSAMSQGAQAQGLDSQMAGKIAADIKAGAANAYHDGTPMDAIRGVSKATADAAKQGMANSSISNVIGDADLATRAGRQAAKAAIGDALSSGQITQAQAIKMAKEVGQGAFKAARGESFVWTGKQLSEGQVYMIFNRVSREDIMEGPMDAIKGLAAKGMSKLKTAGHNLTTKITADKLNKAWQTAGSPLDSDSVAGILSAQGVDQQIVSKVFADLKIPTKSAAPAAGTGYADVKKIIMSLNKKDKQRLMQYITKQMGTV